MSAVIEQIAPQKRGCRKGQVHSGSFKPGFDPRRAPPLKRDLLQSVADVAQESAPKAIKFLQEVMEDTDQLVKVRLIAAKEILDRSIGQSVSMNVFKQIGGNDGLNGGGGNGGLNGDLERLSSSPPADLTDKQLLNVIQGRLHNSATEDISDAVYTELPGEVVEQDRPRRRHRPKRRT